MIIALLNQKGGAGKTTVAVHLADAYRRSGIQSMILDLDPQQSSSAWQRAGGHVQVASVPAGSDPSTFRMSDVFSLILDHQEVSRLVLDCAGRLDRLIGVVEKKADLVVVPIRPSPLDVWASLPTISRLQAYAKATGRPVIRYLINQAVVGTRLARDVEGAINPLGIPIFNSRIHHRVVFADALGIGRTAFDFEPNFAAEEIAALAFEIEEAMS